MPVTYFVLFILVVILVWIIRAKNAAQAEAGFLDLPREIRPIARRFGVRRSADASPVDSIKDPAVPVAALATAFLDVDGTPSDRSLNAALNSLQTELKLIKPDAEDLIMLGRWLVQECGGRPGGNPSGRPSV